MKKYFKKYTLGIRKKNEEFIYFNPPFYEFWADPFIIEKNGNLFIFFEVFNYFRNKGHISVGIYNESKQTIEKIKPILKKPYHLSYPNIIIYREKYYMIPESYQNKKISLYEFKDFPYEIKLKEHLFNDVVNVDTTVFVDENKVFLFTNPRFDYNTDFEENLDVYYSNDIVGPYKKIKEVSIDKYDKSNLRMAGNILRRKGNYYRVSQNCERIYGEHMNLNHILNLSPDKYVEKHCGKFNLGINEPHHTYNESKSFEVIDVVKSSNFSFILFTLFYRFPIMIFKKIKNIVKDMINKRIKKGRVSIWKRKVIKKE